MKQEIVNFPVTLLGKWQSPSEDVLSQLSASLKDWLLDEGSLTARLKSHCNDFKVKVVGERQEYCTESEACDAIKLGEPVLVREVLLYCDNVPQVFARSLLPLSSLTGEGRSLANLGEQPLGQVLFNNPSLQRQGLALSTFAEDSRVGKLASSLVEQSSDVRCRTNTNPNPTMWGRRSIFMIENKPLMVAEVFLLGAFAYKEYDT